MIVPLIIVMFIAFITAYFSYTKMYEYKKEAMRESIDAANLILISRISTQLNILAHTDKFLDYLHSGKKLDETLHSDLMTQISNLQEDGVVGMQIATYEGNELLKFGISSKYTITLSLDYSDKTNSPETKTSKYLWTLFFDKPTYIQALNKINPAIKAASENCMVIINPLDRNTFGVFNIISKSRMNTCLTTSNNTENYLFYSYSIVLFLLLLLLLIWNRYRIRNVVEYYVTSPLKSLTENIKSGKFIENTHISKIDEFNFLAKIIQAAQFELRDSEQAKKDAQIGKLGGHVAHELRTPLASLLVSAQGAKFYLEALINGYQLAASHNLISNPIDPLHFRSLKGTAVRQERVAKKALLVIDVLTQNINHIQSHNIDEVFYIKDCIRETIEHFSMAPEERSVINLKDGLDFEIKGNFTVMMHVMYNLFKNSHYYIYGNPCGKIDIYGRTSKNFNELYFEDNGSGISEEDLPKIFERFYTKREEGSGLGLAFCKLIMERISGGISCSSVKGKYTQFILKFPRVNKIT